MTKRVFFDTDCISSFMWVGEKNIIEELFDVRIAIPEQVYEELSNPKVSHLKEQTDGLIKTGKATIESIELGSSAFLVYRKMTEFPAKPIIGKGEAAAIALAYVNNGILASNNLKDVSKYVEQYELDHITTLDILIMAEEKGIVSNLQCESIWRHMRRKHIRLPEGSYISNKMRNRKISNYNQLP